MLAMESKLGRSVEPRRGAALRVERTDVLFCDTDGDQVRIQITVHNAGDSSSQPTLMTVESAPLGAFVTWRPLTQVTVPALGPGESLELSIEVPRPRSVPLGDFNRVPPRRVLTALDSQDEPLQPKTGIQAFLERLWKARSTPSQRSRLVPDTSLAPDLWDLLGRGQPHWAGNLNVFVGNHAVERHLAKALRVYPERTNLALFVVGNSHGREAFAFETLGLDSTWTTALYDVTNGKSLVVAPAGSYIEKARWVESNGGLLVMLATQPPKDCRTGHLEVHVTRHSDQQTAIVEFDLNPAAQGPGCYFL